MTTTQIFQIYTDLKKWKEIRHLTSENQLKGIVPNLLEEFVEYERAENTIDKIDALCDLIVFCLNSIDNQDLLTFNLNNFDKQSFSMILQYISNIREIQNKDNSDINIIENLLIRIFNICVDKINELNFKPYECLLETTKELNSRKGEWKDSINKFVKFKGVYSKDGLLKSIKNINEYLSIEETENMFILINKTTGEKTSFIKWYKANYNNCKKD